MSERAGGYLEKWQNYLDTMSNDNEMTGAATADGPGPSFYNYSIMYPRPYFYYYHPGVKYFFNASSSIVYYRPHVQIQIPTFYSSSFYLRSNVPTELNAYSIVDPNESNRIPLNGDSNMNGSLPGTSCPANKRRPNVGNIDDLASFFECPVCFDYVLPPIFQCQAGHLVCSACRPKLNCCPTCRGPLGNIRNLAMEKVANTVFFPCKYSSNGCPSLLLHTEKTEHEDACEFRPYICPCPGASCKWQGSLEQVMPHLMMSHKSITTLQGEDIVFLATDINLPGAVDWVMMQSCFNHHFMLVLEKQDKNDGQQFFAIVQLIGSRKQAEKFAYRLELNGQKRRLTWEATPRSIHEGVSSAILNSDCLVFDTSIAQLFSENGNLGINVTISMNHFS